MSSLKATAHRAGLVYLVFSIIAVIGEFMFPTFLVPGDAAATTHNIASAVTAYRLSILTGFVTHLFFIVLVVILYKLFKDVDQSLAMLMVLLVCIGVTVALANLVNKFGPLVILSGADYLSVFTQQQLDAMTLGFLRLHGRLSSIPLGFWGLWLFPFGLLTIKSRYFPRILGVLQIIAGVAYVVSSVAAIVFPDQRGALTRVMTPLYFGEVPMVFWLLLKGAKAPEVPQPA